MSILIKGVEMPMGCADCPFLSDWDVCRATGREINPLTDENRMEWCPIVEIPTPHGHLIDSAELLSAKFAGIYYDPIVGDGVEKTDEEVYAYRVGWNTALDAAYLNAPIVVSAEDG